jgi:4a-hydroxytetrahydrobiopterin dehydratase
MKIKKVSDIGWDIKSGKLNKQFKFNNFNEALDFINQIGKIAEVMNHHPEIRNIYNKVELFLITHDEQKITEKDHNLAEKIDRIYSNF